MCSSDLHVDLVHAAVRVDPRRGGLVRPRGAGRADEAGRGEPAGEGDGGEALADGAHGGSLGRIRRAGGAASFHTGPTRVRSPRHAIRAGALGAALVPSGPVGLVVQKFGGSSVADPDRIRAVADHVIRTRRAGHDVVVVVSAMGKSTDDLLRLAHDVAGTPSGREMDMLLTAGERIDRKSTRLNSSH